MEDNNLEKTKEILEKLSPDNQLYFMTLVKVAAIAEAGVKKHTVSDICVDQKKQQKE